MTSATGRCLCGAVKFTADGVKTRYHACHCGMCRRWSGGPLFAAATERVTFEGAENVATYQSSEWAERGFCKACGTNLFYHLKPTGQYIMCVGAFDDQTPFQLAGELYIDHKPAGYAFAGDLKQMTEAEVIAKYVTSDGKD